MQVTGNRVVWVGFAGVGFGLDLVRFLLGVCGGTVTVRVLTGRCHFVSAHELWFKQILYELDLVRRIFCGEVRIGRPVGIVSFFPEFPGVGGA